MFTIRNLGGVALLLMGTTWLWLTPAFAGPEVSTSTVMWRVTNVLSLLTIAGFCVATWGLFARPAHLLSPSFIGMLREWRRFNREARALIGMNGTAPSLGHWLEQQGFSRHFVERLIVPQASAVWSADPAQMWSFPASFMAEFFENHGMYSLRDRPRWHLRERQLGMAHDRGQQAVEIVRDAARHLSGGLQS